MEKSDAFKRGVYDAQRDKSPLFRRTRARGIVTDLEDFDEDVWTEEKQEEYLKGYDSYFS